MNKSPTHDLKTCKCSAPHSVPSQLCPVRVTPPSSFMQFTAGYISPIFACDYKEVEPTRAPLSPPAGYLFLLEVNWTLGFAVECTLLPGCASKRPHPHLCDAPRRPGSALCASLHAELSPELVTVWPAKREETRLTPALPTQKIA